MSLSMHLDMCALYGHWFGHAFRLVFGHVHRHGGRLFINMCLDLVLASRASMREFARMPAHTSMHRFICRTMAHHSHELLAASSIANPVALPLSESVVGTRTESRSQACPTQREAPFASSSARPTTAAARTSVGACGGVLFGVSSGLQNQGVADVHSAAAPASQPPSARPPTGACPDVCVTMPSRSGWVTSEPLTQATSISGVATSNRGCIAGVQLRTLSISDTVLDEAPGKLKGRQGKPCSCRLSYSPVTSQLRYKMRPACDGHAIESRSMVATTGSLPLLPQGTGRGPLVEDAHCETAWCFAG